MSEKVIIALFTAATSVTVAFLAVWLKHRLSHGSSPLNTSKVRTEEKSEAQGDTLTIPQAIGCIGLLLIGIAALAFWPALF